MSDVFLPLRSNAGWFSNEDTHAQLASRFKNLLLFNDTLIVQDGRYEASFLAGGSSDHLLRGEHVKNREQIRYHQPGSTFQVRVAPSGTSDFKPILSGPIEASYEADFWPVLAEAGITRADYVKWVQVDLTPDGQTIVDRAVSLARLDPLTGAGLPDNRFLRSKIIKSVYSDALLAAGLGAPISVDSHAASVISHGNTTAAAGWSPDVRGMLENAWLTLGLPSAGTEPWDSVLRARESAAGKDLRRVMDRLSALAVKCLTESVDQSQWQEEANKLLVREIIAELLERRPNVLEAGVSFGLNFIPLVGTAVGTLRDAVLLVKDHRSWVSLLSGLPRAPVISVKE